MVSIAETPNSTALVSSVSAAEGLPVASSNLPRSNRASGFSESLRAAFRACIRADEESLDSMNASALAKYSAPVFSLEHDVSREAVVQIIKKKHLIGSMTDTNIVIRSVYRLLLPT